ncbi:MAG: hypothetical protein H0X29_11100, partial [Parachlamydiaceae bacterium]|nr:hypothetical protein [Parachlamydiaceae bacterium]
MHTKLSPPLQLLQKACLEAKIDFISTLVSFLKDWDAQHNWLYDQSHPLSELAKKAFAHINWKKHPKSACQLTASLFNQLEPVVTNGSQLLEALQEMQWPLIDACHKLKKENPKNLVENTGSLMKLVTQQIFSVADQLPIEKSSDTIINPQQHARLLSAYLRVYGIHLNTITPALSDLEFKKLMQENHNSSEIYSPFIIETPLVAMLEEAPKSKKLEDNLPAITLQAQEGNRRQTLSLGYDRFAQGLKWPILNGAYLLRFQPLFEEIPYNIRLRQARQINYANS